MTEKTQPSAVAPPAPGTGKAPARGPHVLQAGSGRCRSTTTGRWGTPAPTPTPGASTARPTASGSGPCASTPGSRPPPSPTGATATCSRRGRPGSRSRSICRPRSATTPTRRRRAAKWAGSASPSTRIHDMRRLFDGIPLDQVTTSMTINSTASILLALYLAVAEEQGVGVDEGRRHACRTTSSRSTRRAGPTSIRPARRSSWSPTWSRSAPSACRSGTRSRSRATTSAKPARPRCRRSRSRSPTASATSTPRSSAASRSTSSRRALSFFFNAHNDFLEEVAKFRAARRLWAELLTRALRAQGPALAVAALPHPDRRLDAHRAAARQQRGAGGDPGAGRGVRRHAVAPHQRPRRSAGPAHRGLGAARAAHAADRRARERHHQVRRSARRLVGDRGRRPIASCARRATTSRRSTAWAARAPRSSAASSSTRSPRPPTPRSARSRRASRSSSA